MRFCTLLRGEPGPDGVLREAEIVDVSLVDDGHLTGRDADGLWHIPGGQLEYAEAPAAFP